MYFLLTTEYCIFVSLPRSLAGRQLITFFLQTVEQLRTNYCNALCAVHSVLATNYGVNLLCYLALLVYTIHARVLHVMDIQYMFVKRNRKNWEKNATERNGRRNITEWNGTREETLQNRTAGSFSIHSTPVRLSFNSRSHPLFIEWASHSTDRTGELFDTYCQDKALGL